MSSSAPKSNDNTPANPPTTSSQTDEKQASNLPSLGALDEDDEFEEFEEQDWPDAATDLSQIAASTTTAKGQSVGLTMGSSSHPQSTNAAGATSASGDHLWQDSWDDDTVEDDFSKALRAELEKQNGAQAM